MMVARGKCHLCKTDQEVRHCGRCGHWFCAGCRRKYPLRIAQAIKQVVVGAKAKCCGPGAIEGAA